MDPYPNVVILPAPKSASVNPCAAEKPGNTGPKDLIAWDQGAPSAQQPTMGEICQHSRRCVYKSYP